MSRIPREAVVRAVAKVPGMGFADKQRLADELFHAQPHVLASVLVQGRLGVSAEKMDFLLGLVPVAFQAMKESGLAWPLITEDEQNRRMARLSEAIRFREELPEEQRADAMMDYVRSHPEQELLAFVYTETTRWLQRVVPEESDKYVMLAALNFVECIAYVPMPALGTTRGDQLPPAVSKGATREPNRTQAIRRGRNRKLCWRNTTDACG